MDPIGIVNETGSENQGQAHSSGIEHKEFDLKNIKQVVLTGLDTEGEG